MDQALRHPLGGRKAWAVWLTAVLIYALSVFNRSSLGVAGVMAAERFHINSSQLATFVMVQLLVYSVMQVPVGALLDRVGSKVMLIAGVVFMTVAQAGFAVAHTFAAGVIARVVVGMGDAMVFVSVIRLVALWFPPLRIPMVTQATGWFGQLGALAAAGPLSQLLHGFGWSTAFLVASGAGVVFGAALVLIVQDSPYRDQERTELRMRAVGRALRLAWKHPGTQLGLWSHFTAQFSATVFALIWGFPFLTAGEGLSPTQASVLLSLMVVTTVISSPLVGAFVARYPYSRSSLVLGIVATMMVFWTIVLAWPGRAPLWLLVLLVAATAVGGPGSVVGFDLARTFNPPTRLGSATGIVNVGGFVASLSTVWLIGLVLDQVAPGGPTTYTVDHFRVAMTVQYFVWAVGIVQILRLRKRTRGIVDTDDSLHHLRRRRERTGTGNLPG